MCWREQTKLFDDFILFTAGTTASRSVYRHLKQAECTPVRRTSPSWRLVKRRERPSSRRDRASAVIWLSRKVFENHQAIVLRLLVGGSQAFGHGWVRLVHWAPW